MRRIGLVALLVMLALASAAPALAQETNITVGVSAFPEDIVPSGATVTFDVLLMLAPAEEAMIITAIDSERYGDVTDSANPGLVDTACSVPSTREPGDYYGAYDWGCRYRAWIEGEPGEVVDTVTVTVVRADGSDVVATGSVSVTIGTATGAIRGTLTDDVTGEPLAGILVMAFGEERGGMSETDQAGRYSMDDLAPGEYRLFAGNSMHQASVYAGEWWDDAESYQTADPVMVVGGEVTTVDWSLSLGGVIEGTVSDEATGAPLAGVDISWVAIASSGQREGPMGGYSTDDTGSYRIPGLHAAGYLICFDVLGYLPECWDDETDFGEGVEGIPGDPVIVEPRTVVSGIDAALARFSVPTSESPSPEPTLPFTGAPAATGQASLLALAGLVAGGATLLVTRRRGEKLKRYGKKFFEMTPARLAIRTIRDKGLRTAIELGRKRRR